MGTLEGAGTHLYGPFVLSLLLTFSFMWSCFPVCTRPALLHRSHEGAHHCDHLTFRCSPQRSRHGLHSASATVFLRHPACSRCAPTVRTRGCSTAACSPQRKEHTACFCLEIAPSLPWELCGLQHAHSVMDSRGCCGNAVPVLCFVLCLSFSLSAF